jgi:hypothetical protein
LTSFHYRKQAKNNPSARRTSAFVIRDWPRRVHARPKSVRPQAVWVRLATGAQLAPMRPVNESVNKLTVHRDCATRPGWATPGENSFVKFDLRHDLDAAR